MKKILYFITKSNWGGAQKYVLDLAIEAKNKGFLPIVAAGIENKKQELPALLRSEDIPFIEIAGLGRDVSIKQDFVSFVSILKIILKECPDIVHFNSSKMALGLLAARIVRLFKNFPHKIIFTAHGWPFNEPRPHLQKKIIWLISWLSVFLSDKTITVANFDFEKGKVMPFMKNKVVYIPNGIKEIEFVERETARQTLSEITKTPLLDDFIAVTVAELNKNKGQTFLIEAAEILDLPIKFVLIGEGEDGEMLKNLIREKGLQKKVFLTGKIEGANKFLKAFDMFILPSLKEGLPFAILEAGLANLPTVATSVGGVPEIVDDMKSGILVRRGEPLELVTAITYIFNHTDTAEVFGGKLREKVEKDFNWSSMAEETFKLYKREE
jgi:glycosyltransferase involved in cell wall biosynthesis